MTALLIRNHSRAGVPVLRVRYCDAFLCQLRGLMFRRSLAEDEGLLLVQSSESRLNAAIHMFGMAFDLTVVWIDARHRVVDVQLTRRWPPIYFPRRPAQYVLETRTQHFPHFHTGDLLDFEALPEA